MRSFAAVTVSRPISSVVITFRATLLPQINQDTPICAKSWHRRLCLPSWRQYARKLNKPQMRLVKSLFVRDQFDAVTDLAQHLPFVVVRELIGLPDFGKENMLKLGSGGI